MPAPSDKAPTAAQAAARERFQEATAYGKAAKDHPAYAAKAAGTEKTSYNVAVADWYHEPEVAEVDLEAWTGGVGEVLRARARDDVQVTTVQFVLADADGHLVESGAATLGADGWWRYTTTVDHPGGAATVLVTAHDLPGHRGSLEAGKTVV
ncbi:MAG TPA: hypothetical protein PLH19_15055 [Anaerolineae bacterium]|nr:hypothetical protein [Anaerolineae bacterium]HQH39834.1 hypothetical protein [Anaerolineae bacterium]